MAIIRLLSFLLLLPAALPAEEPAFRADEAAQRETAGTEDKIRSSLMFRGEVADALIEAGLAGKVVDLEGLETHAEVRSALLAWISRHPAQAAGLYAGVKGSGGKAPQGLDTTERTFKLDEGFLELVKNLNAAAADKSISDEAMELAAKRLYESSQAEAEVGAPAVRAGGGRAGAGSSAGGRLFTYADYKLDADRLLRETAAAGAWLDAAKGPHGRGPEGLERTYGEAVSVYGSFLVMVSGLKGRLVTEKESRAVEGGRAALRLKLAELALASRCADLEAMARRLEAAGDAPGAAALRASILALKAGMEGYVSQVRAGMDLRALAALADRAEREFSAAYLRYCAYSGLLALRQRSAAPGFSCLYDYLVYRCLAAFFPSAAYPAARAELAAAGPLLDSALGAAGSGDPSAALAGLGPRAAAIAAAASLTAGASAFNRAAQFFQWGIFFRPAEVQVGFKGGRPSYRPVFAFAALREGR